MSLKTENIKTLSLILDSNFKDNYCSENNYLKELFQNPETLINLLFKAGLDINEVIYFFHSGLEIAVQSKRSLRSQDQYNIPQNIEKFEYSFGLITMIFYYLDGKDYVKFSYPTNQIKRHVKLSSNKLEIFVVGNNKICYKDYKEECSKCTFLHYFYLPKPVAEKISIILNKMFKFNIEYLKYNPINCFKNQNCIYTLKSSSENKIDDNFFIEFAKRYWLTF